MVSRILKCWKHNIGFDGNLHQQIFLEVESSTHVCWFGLVLKVLSYNVSFQTLYIEWDSMFILFIFSANPHGSGLNSAFWNLDREPHL